MITDLGVRMSPWLVTKPVAVTSILIALLASTYAPASVAAPAITSTTPSSSTPSANGEMKLNADMSADRFIFTAQRIMRTIATGEPWLVYDSGSPTLKQAQNRNSFIANAQAIRAQYGVADRYFWLSIARLTHPAPKETPPHGGGVGSSNHYVTVKFLAMAKSREIATYTVTFCMATPTQAEFCGFSVTPVNAAVPQHNKEN